MNLSDVARLARVSAITVSRVVNNSPVVKDTTRRRVLRAVEELNYHPNLHARSLAVHKSQSIGVIVSNIENPFFLDIYKSVEKGVRAAGYEAIMANTGYRSEQLVASVRLMIGLRVDGLAAIGPEMPPELIAELDQYRIPLVLCDVRAQTENIAIIRVNYRRGMDRLADYLYGLGHRRVGVVGNHRTLRPMDERAQAVMESLARFPDVDVQAATCTDSPEGGHRAACILLSAHPKLTALVFVNDFMAVGGMRHLRERGLRVPQDVSVTGFDDVALARHWFPALTSVRIPCEEIGQKICNSLLPGEKEPGNEMPVDPELVLRDSTGPPPRP